MREAEDERFGMRGGEGSTLGGRGGDMVNWMRRDEEGGERIKIVAWHFTQPLKPYITKTLLNHFGLKRRWLLDTQLGVRHN